MLSRPHLRLRNAYSATPEFKRILAFHLELYADAGPLVRADYEHALDTWQWTLRLAPDASLAVQLAGLFHDIERLESAEARVDDEVTDYGAFKQSHAERGAEMTRAFLREARVGERSRVRCASLVAMHENAPRDADALLLSDADALSFLSLGSAGYLAYFGHEQTRRKVRYTLGRLRSVARPLVALMTLEPVLSAMVCEAAPDLRAMLVRARGAGSPPS
jgi:putative nucleotidyltransferase with HDIG domain